jgi:hypothetical protein
MSQKGVAKERQTTHTEIPAAVIAAVIAAVFQFTNVLPLYGGNRRCTCMCADKGCTGSHLNLRNLTLLSMILQLE